MAMSWSRCSISADSSASGMSSSTRVADGLGGLLAQGHVGLEQLAHRQALLEVGPQLGDGLELGGLVGPLVVDLGQHRLLDLFDQDAEVEVVLVGVGIGVLRLELDDVAGLAGEVLVDLGHDGALTRPRRRSRRR